MVFFTGWRLCRLAVPMISTQFALSAPYNGDDIYMCLRYTVPIHSRHDLLQATRVC